MIGKRLKELRRIRGLDQVDLAVVMGYDQPMISRIERGDRGPSEESLINVAREYGVSMDWLYGIETIMEG